MRITCVYMFLALFAFTVHAAEKGDHDRRDGGGEDQHPGAPETFIPGNGHGGDRALPPRELPTPRAAPGVTATPIPSPTPPSPSDGEPAVSSSQRPWPLVETLGVLAVASVIVWSRVVMGGGGRALRWPIWQTFD